MPLNWSSQIHRKTAAASRREIISVIGENDLSIPTAEEWLIRIRLGENDTLTQTECLISRHREGNSAVNSTVVLHLKQARYFEEAQYLGATRFVANVPFRLN